MSLFVPGQCWISETEPELGLGLVARVEGRQVDVLFRGDGSVRRYAAAAAPLRRVRFREGDRIRDRDGGAFVVAEVVEQAGLITYIGGGRRLPEQALADTLGSARPDERLAAVEVDDNADFEIRLAALTHRHRMRCSVLRGLLGARIELIPHQLYIGHEVSSRAAPRVLLSDEVGLGKTIEAGLILHRLHLNGRAERILILVPESLVHQWFVEMLRRFTLWFHIFDEDRCAAIEQGEPGSNPFLDDQLVLTSMDFLTGSPERGGQAAAAGWDLLVVDEAHHLAWTPTAPSPAYALVEAISRQAAGLLLLTATPEQLGEESHFARLRLLDPDRYVDLASFRAEERHGPEVAELAGRLAAGRRLRREDRSALAAVFGPASERALRDADDAKGGDAEARARLLDDLLDQHGPGRVIFRNTRAAVGGFPGRRADLVPLASADDGLREALALELAADAGPGDWRPRYSFVGDPRLEWLADFLAGHPGEKVLLICRFREMVLALAEALRGCSPAKVGLFHEGLTLVQRDRQAAWFAEPDGARILLCSEIGGEGRNFQFAHDLVLFDLPLEPELLEQRIGRLDRIGQTEVIRVHVPYIEGSAQEVLARWYHEGLGAIETSLHGGHACAEHFGGRVLDLALARHLDPARTEAELVQLLDEGRAARAEIGQRLEAGRDRLLEMTSFRAGAAADLAEGVRALDRDRGVDEFLLELLGLLGVEGEETEDRTYLIRPGPLQADALPGLPAEGLLLTADRGKALAREDIGFLSWDHPLVGAAIDMLLGSPRGASSVAVLADGGEPGVFLEAIFVLEAIAPARLHVDRFLPPTPIRVAVDAAGQDIGDTLAGPLRDGGHVRVLRDTDLARTAVPRLTALARPLAEARGGRRISEALDEMRRQLGRELHRLRGLRAAHGAVRQAEIDALTAQREDLAQSIGAARLRLDTVRLILRGLG